LSSSPAAGDAGQSDSNTANTAEEVWYSHVFERKVLASSEFEAYLKISIYLEDEVEDAWSRVARKFIDDSEAEPTKEFDSQKTTVKHVLMTTLIELPRNKDKRDVVLEIMELKKKYAESNTSFPRRSKKKSLTPELRKLFRKCDIFDGYSCICNTYVARIRQMIVKMVKENDLLNMTPEDHIKEKQKNELVTSASLMYKVIHCTHQPTAIHWTSEQCERLNLDDSDICGISGYLSACDLIRAFSKLGLLKPDTIFLDVGSGFGHVVIVVSLFGVKCSIGFDVHFPTVATSLAALSKIMNRGKLRGLLKSPIVLYEASAAFMKDVSPVDVVYSFIGCHYLAEYVAKIVAYSTTVKHVVLVITHNSYLEQYGFLGDGDLVDQDASNLTDHIFCGSASMPGGASYPIIALYMTPARRQRMKAILERDCKPIFLPDHWVEIKKAIENEDIRMAYMDNYIDDKFKNRPLTLRAMHSPVTLMSEYTPASSSSSSSSSSLLSSSSSSSSSSSCVEHTATRKKRKASGKASEEESREVLLASVAAENASLRTENASLKKQNVESGAGSDESEELAALRVLLAQKSARIEELEGADKQQQGLISWLEGRLSEVEEARLLDPEEGLLS